MRRRGRLGAWHGAPSGVTGRRGSGMQGESGEAASMVRPTLVGDEARPRNRGVGALLRETRMAGGDDLRRIATRLRIRYPYLEAIEEGRFDKLPGTTYAVGFVRGYAEYLGLDGAEIVRRFKQETACVDSKTELVFPEPPPERGVPGGAILLIALALSVVGYGGWYYLSTRDGAPPELVAAVPQRFEAPATQPLAVDPPAPLAALPASPPSTNAPSAGANRTPEPVREAMGARTAIEAIPVAPAPPVISAPAPPPPVAALAPAPIAPGATPPVTTDPRGTDSVRAPAPMIPAPPPAAAAATRSSDAPPAGVPSAADSEGEIGRLFGAIPAESRVQIRALSDSWVQVRDSDGSLLLTRVLRTGDIYRVPDRSGVTMRTGNAGGLEVSVDGKLVAPVGPLGSVRRNVALDADRLVAGTAVAE